MSEYFRTDTHQAVDVPLAFIIDTFTGQVVRPAGRDSVCSLEEALERLKRAGTWGHRYAVVKLDGIALRLIEGQR
jgi:2-iminoacetate synthase ThiH